VCYFFIKVLADVNYDNDKDTRQIPVDEGVFFIMALESFVRTWPLFQFLDPIHSQ
jgi:hypothetical protein